MHSDRLEVRDGNFIKEYVISYCNCVCGVTVFKFFVCGKNMNIKIMSNEYNYNIPENNCFTSVIQSFNGMFRLFSYGD